ncbi:MAG: ABC transporter substrate-binding protein [Acidimicrobiia bacterium]|nr:ABC transporter substrate-binding protein [Acidimicrobiia bacterium]
MTAPPAPDAPPGALTARPGVGDAPGDGPDVSWARTAQGTTVATAPRTARHDAPARPRPPRRGQHVEPQVDRPNGSQSAARIMRGWGPLAGFVAALLLMSLLIPTKGPVVVTEFTSADDAAASGGKSSAGSGAGTSTGDVAGTQAQTGGAPPGAEVCPDRTVQVPGDPYSPPCFAFSADNGGATTKGVTGDKIVVTARMSRGTGFQDALQQAAGADISDTPEDLMRTMEALAEYFNTRFQLYGRKIEFKFFFGKGDSTVEVLGGGQEGAEADAVQVAEELGAFAELNATTPPFADALSRRNVMNFGAPYMSREWLTQRRPYSWSQLTDCSIVVETTAEYLNKRLAGKPASHAGPGLQGKPRSVGLVAPENSWYQECVKAGRAVVDKAGNSSLLVADEKYKLDLGLMSNQATNLIAKLKSTGATTILCGCDPVMLVFMTQKAEEQDYHPEWIVSGVAFSDQDMVGQLFQQDQWQRAFGISYAGAPQPLRASFGYNAYKSVRDDEPAFSVDLIYYQMYMLAIGLQMAGPQLTPETFEQGMFNYPGGTGPAGTWKFGANQYTPTQDAREVWYSRDTRSTQNGEVGAYIDTSPGTRYPVGQWPAGDPPVFQGG